MGSNELFQSGAKSAYFTPPSQPSQPIAPQASKPQPPATHDEREKEKEKEEKSAFVDEKAKVKAKKEISKERNNPDKEEEKTAANKKKEGLSREKNDSGPEPTEKDPLSAAMNRKTPSPNLKKRKKRRIRIASMDQSASVAEEKTTHEKEDFGTLEKKLREFDFYHGFLPREDLLSTLQHPGDYLLRVSEVHEETKVTREVILSLIPIQDNANKEEDGKVKCRNVCIKRAANNMFFCEVTRAFESINELIAHYTKNTGTCSSAVFQLKTPIPQQPWEFMHSDVTVGKTLGEGAFGKVSAGTLKLKDGSVVDVAIKMTKGSSQMNKMKIKEMMNEARFIRNFQHRNVVRLYGVAHDEQPLYILLEIVRGGSLQDYMKKNAKEVSVTEKVKFCTGAARGIEYLHANNCIHRDIAARNCLLSDDPKQREVKITDFGLSRTGPSYKIKTSCKLPVKWLAPETISTYTFTFSTDVYSWGVTCFEVFADGVEPFDGITNAQVKVDVLAGKYLQMPSSTPDVVKKYLSSSVLVDGARRATMSDAVQEFTKFIGMAESGALEPHGAKKLLRVFKKK